MSEAKNRILLIEDEEDIVEALKMRLEGNGYEVIPALDGTDGLNKARTVGPDLIILDIMLPKLDGYKIARMLKFDERFSIIPILMLTAKVQPADALKGKEAGADSYMTKPFKADELLMEIKRLIVK